MTDEQMLALLQKQGVLQGANINNPRIKAIIAAMQEAYKLGAESK